MLNFYSKNELYTFDDVCLVPQFSEVSSRNDISLTSGKLQLKLPIMSANMDTVTEVPMLLAMYEAGGLGILHRFMSLQRLKELVTDFTSYFGGGAKYQGNGFDHLALSVGVKQSQEWLEFCAHHAKVICIDIAHAHSKHTLETINKIKKFNQNNIVIAGNIATPQAVGDLVDAGADLLKLGIGPGSFCTTRVVTGHGIPQLSAISMCAERAKELGVETIADGGIRNSGDIAKSIAAGADYVMIGSLLAATDEAPGRVVDINGQRYKEYRGSASFEVQVASGKDKSQIVPEGASQLKLCKGPAKDVLAQLAGGLRSALSYSGSFDIDTFKRKAMFVRVTSNSYVEGTPHGLKSK